MPRKDRPVSPKALARQKVRRIDAIIARYTLYFEAICTEIKKGPLTGETRDEFLDERIGPQARPLLLRLMRDVKAVEALQPVPRGRPPAIKSKSKRSGRGRPFLESTAQWFLGRIERTKSRAAADDRDYTDADALKAVLVRHLMEDYQRSGHSLAEAKKLAISQLKNSAAWIKTRRSSLSRARKNVRDRAPRTTP